MNVVLLEVLLIYSLWCAGCRNVGQRSGGAGLRRLRRWCRGNLCYSTSRRTAAASGEAPAGATQTMTTCVITLDGEIISSLFSCEIQRYFSIRIFSPQLCSFCFDMLIILYKSIVLYQENVIICDMYCLYYKYKI